MSDFLGKGWAFPPLFDKQIKTVEMAQGVDDINQSLKIILSTSLGERVLRPDFGCNLKDFQFEPMNGNFIGYLKDMVLRALLYHEPRIRVERVSVNEDQQWEGKLLIHVEYQVRATNSRFNYVYDFYIKGETGII